LLSLVAEAFVYTDPACPWSWGAEPALRRVQAAYGDALPIRFVMGGLAREFARPLETMRHWIDAGDASGMPVDPRLWLDAPPRSSYPGCLAVKAAAEQGMDAPFLRRAREGFAYERRSLDRPDALIELARTVPGLDVERFRSDLSSSAVTEAFGADLERTRTVAPELRGDRPRVGLPSLQVIGPAGEAWAYDTHEVDAWDAAVARAGVAAPSSDGRLDPVAALRRFGRMATPEIAAVCELPGPTAPAELWRLAAAWQVRATRHVSGEMWEAS
jgi:predicted DsbA family dithiol-disulfide isomerase